MGPLMKIYPFRWSPATAMRPYIPSVSQSHELATQKKKKNEKRNGTPGLARDSVRGLPRRLLWLLCPGQTGVTGNDRADTLAGKGAVTSGLYVKRKI